MHFASILPESEYSYLKADLGGITLVGKSIAGIETVLCLPQLDLCFDTGRAPDFAVNQSVLGLTHWHLDHAGGILNFLGLRCLNSLPPLKIIVPDEKKEQAIEFLNSAKKISESKITFEILSANQTFSLKKDYQISGISNFHCTPSTGYLVETIKNKLKPEFADLDGSEIVLLKNKGVEITQQMIQPYVAFSGDSMGEFLQTPAAKASVLIMECSFFGDESDYAKVRHYGHTHIDDWRQHAELIESDFVVMTHTSVRYSKKDIEVACRKKLPGHLLERLVVWR